jgi:poly-gamma-glutamate capsule biosynthesis protein CapA/YwtB (metallophosphatase superfamily)
MPGTRQFLLLLLLSSLIFSVSPVYAAGLTVLPDPNATAAPALIGPESLMAVGDIAMIYGNDGPIVANPERPWVNIKPLLNQATLLMGNQEVPLSGRGAPYTQKKYILRSDPRTVNSLVAAGFDVVTLANNHIMDYGPTALQDTLATLDAVKIAHTGAGMNLSQARQAALLTTPSGVSATRPGTPYGASSYFTADIRSAKALADLVIVSFHWSDERITNPFPYQKQYGRQCIDAGAAAVIGHHPHVLQGLEVYKGGLIAYSLGNFVFGSPSVGTSDTIILGMEYDKNGLLQAKLYPINVNYLQPILRRGADAERLLNNVRSLSAQFGTAIESQGEVGVIKVRK